MEAFCEIILDMENDLSRMKEVSENVPEQLEYAHRTRVSKRVIQVRLKTIQGSLGAYSFLRCNFSVTS